MKRAKAIRILSIASVLALIGLAAPAFGQINFNINVAPPAPQHESAPVLAPGQVWAPGYWAWHGERYIWVRGRPIVQRSGYRWEPDRWEQRDGRYFRHAGQWERDRDFNPGKWKKEKKFKDRDGDDRGERGDNHGRGNGKHGKGGKHDD